MWPLFPPEELELACFAPVARKNLFWSETSICCENQMTLSLVGWSNLIVSWSEPWCGLVSKVNWLPEGSNSVHSRVLNRELTTVSTVEYRKGKREWTTASTVDYRKGNGLPQENSCRSIKPCLVLCCQLLLELEQLQMNQAVPLSKNQAMPLSKNQATPSLYMFGHFSVTEFSAAAGGQSSVQSMALSSGPWWPSRLWLRGLGHCHCWMETNKTRGISPLIAQVQLP